MPYQNWCRPSSLSADLSIRQQAEIIEQLLKLWNDRHDSDWFVAEASGIERKGNSHRNWKFAESCRFAMALRIRIWVSSLTLAVNWAYFLTRRCSESKVRSKQKKLAMKTASATGSYGHWQLRLQHGTVPRWRPRRGERWIIGCGPFASYRIQGGPHLAGSNS
jgi:hypothetical protein